METKPTYKTAEALGIEQWEHDGLVALVGPLSRGELPYNQGEDCGTAMCIGGWLAHFNGRATTAYVDSKWDSAHPKKGLSALFWLGLCCKDSTKAARAIVNFLVTGNPSWDKVMSEG